MSFFFLKRSAKDKLSGSYFYAMLGVLLCYIPAYILSLATTIMTTQAMLAPLAFITALVAEVFVIDIFTVGYVRSLLDLGDKPAASEHRYDINLVLSGFANNYKNTLKIMFMRKLYIFGWSCLMMLPIILAVGVIAFMSTRPEIVGLGTRFLQLIQSPTEDMMINFGTYVADNCSYVVYILGIAVVASLVLTIPYIRKVYSYEMIPMIIAENPDISSSKAFSKTKEIMYGYRMNYFFLQMSFIGLMILVSFVIVLVPFSFAIYIAMALVMPYVNMTFVEFYLSRIRNIADIKTNREESDKYEN